MKSLFSTIAISSAFFVTSLAAQTPGRIAERKENQQDRIAQGVRSGQLTPGETASLERKESTLNREARAGRKLHGGKLTRRERRRLNRRRNRLSGSIYRDKHNAARQ